MTTLDTTSATEDIDDDASVPAPHALNESPRHSASTMVALDGIDEHAAYARNLQEPNAFMSMTDQCLSYARLKRAFRAVEHLSGAEVEGFTVWFENFLARYQELFPK